MPIANPYSKPSNPYTKVGPGQSKEIVITPLGNGNASARNVECSVPIVSIPSKTPAASTKLAKDFPSKASKKIPCFKEQLKIQIQQLKQKKKLEKERKEHAIVVERQKREQAEQSRLQLVKQQHQKRVKHHSNQTEKIPRETLIAVTTAKVPQPTIRPQHQVTPPQTCREHGNSKPTDSLVAPLCLSQQPSVHYVDQVTPSNSFREPSHGNATPMAPSLQQNNYSLQPSLIQQTSCQVTPSASYRETSQGNSVPIGSSTTPLLLVSSSFPPHHNVSQQCLIRKSLFHAADKDTVKLPLGHPHVIPPLWNCYQHPFYPNYQTHPTYPVNQHHPYYSYRPHPMLPQKPLGLLSNDLLTSPSPYSRTHTLLPIVIEKPLDGVFGISLRVDTTSVLVEPELTDRDMIINVLHDMVNNISTRNNQNITTRRRKRRRRMAFRAMCVAKANGTLKVGDIIISIHGSLTSGRSFDEACKLFGGGTATEGGMIQCELLVGRRKQVVMPVAPLVKAPTPVLPTKIPFVCSETTNQTLRGDFSANELIDLFNGVVKLLTDKTRILGYKALDVVEKAVLCLPLREFSDVKKKLAQMNRELELTLISAAKQHWNGAPWTDSQRATLRALPRPILGCRCGSKDHTHVNNPMCGLYSNLHPVPSFAPPRQPLETSLKDLSALETAYKDRFIKLKEEQERDQDEARFVAEMEHIQVSTVGKAIFVPSFTAMILSSIATVSDDFESQAAAAIKKRILHAKEQIRPPAAGVESDDDVLLTSLGKRGTAPTNDCESKKVNANEFPLLDVGFNILFLAKLLVHISKTWGHLYREPVHKDYAWRWELFHGSNSEHGTNPGGKNPRRPRSASLENVQFGFKEVQMSRLEEWAFGTREQRSDPKETESEMKQAAQDGLAIAYLVSPERSGLLDELLVLLRSRIIRKTRNGGAVFRRDWASQVDLLLLNDMYAHWSLDADPENKHCMHNKVRYNLASYWIRIDGAWALSEDMSEIIYIDEEFDEWRQTFESKADMKSNEEEGIGRFGI